MQTEYSKYLFVTGMFRSGTTLAARMLNTHSRIIFAADPAKEFFKAFRNEIYFQNGFHIENTEKPLESNFKNSDCSKIKQKIENTDFKIPIKFTSQQELVQKIKRSSEPFSPFFAKSFENPSAETFSGLLEEILETIKHAYFKEDANIIGFKDVWCEQFAPTFLNEFDKKGRVIFIIRDPRAIVASNYTKTNHRYPLEFLIRQWRKSVCYALLYSKVLQKYNDRCLLVKYEDLVLSPEESIKKMINFLNIESEDDIFYPSKYKDGSGNAWKQNTSYELNAADAFNPKSVEKWKETLSDDHISFIEYTCFPEMQALDYQFQKMSVIETNNPPSYPPEDTQSHAEWIRVFYPPELVKDNKWMKKIESEENTRNRIFLYHKQNKTDQGNYNENDVEDYFVDKRLFEYLVDVHRKGVKIIE